MGNFDSGYNEYLRVGKLAGSLSAEEENIFNQLMETDAAFRQSFSELTQTLTPSYLSTLQKYKDPGLWPSVNEIAPRKTILRRLAPLQVAVAASALLAIGITIFVLLNRGAAQGESGQLAGVELRLSNGRTINLSESKGSIPTDAVTLKNTGSGLTYDLTSPAPSGINTITVAPGMDYQVVLADGSEVWLNSTSSLEFPFAFTGNTRDITIRGEAYLKIAKNQQHPFIVHLPDSKVQVTGTEFNVNSFDSAVVKISLVEGAVLFVGGKDSIALTPGRQGVYAKGENLYDQSFNQRNTLSWMQGIHYFEKSGMDEIIGVISRWYNVKVVVDNSRNSDKRFVGVLNKKKPLADFLKTLEYVADIYSYYDSRGVLHFK